MSQVTLGLGSKCRRSDLDPRSRKVF